MDKSKYKKVASVSEVLALCNYEVPLDTSRSPRVQHKKYQY